MKKQPHKKLFFSKKVISDLSMDTSIVHMKKPTNNFINNGNNHSNNTIDNNNIDNSSIENNETDELLDRNDSIHNNDIEDNDIDIGKESKESSILLQPGWLEELRVNKEVDSNSINTSENREKELFNSVKNNAGKISSNIDFIPFIMPKHDKSYDLIPPLSSKVKRDIDNNKNNDYNNSSNDGIYHDKKLPLLFPHRNSTDSLYISELSFSITKTDISRSLSNNNDIISTNKKTNKKTSNFINNSKQLLKNDAMVSNLNKLKSEFIASSLLHSISDKPNIPGSYNSYTPGGTPGGFTNSGHMYDMESTGGGKNKIKSATSEMKIKNYIKDLNYSRHNCGSIHQFSKGT